MKNAIPYAFAAVLMGLGLRLHAASLLQFSATSYNVTEGMSRVEIVVQRASDLDTIVSVDFTTTNLTATAGADYLDVSTKLTLQAGETNQIVVVPILNDGLAEANETFRLLLANPAGGAELGPRSSATVRISDNDLGLQVEFAQYQAREDEGSVLIAVLRGDDGDSPVTVEYATADGVARAGEDYAAAAGKLDFAAGEKLKLLTIPLLNDGTKEADQTFRLSLANAAGTVLGSPTSATITIVDNDPGVQFEYSRFWVRENDGVLTVRVSRGNDGELGAFAVDYATANQTATAGEDYTEAKGTLEFATGDTVKLLTIPITGDEVAEQDETFTVTLGNLTGSGNLGTITRAPVTILDTTGAAAHRFEGITVLPDPAWLTLFDRQPYLVSHAVADAPCATEGQPYPIVLFSHGLGASPRKSLRSQAAEKAEDLASHGYLVVAMDHFDAAFPVFPDGSVGPVSTATMTAAGFQDRVRDLSFVLEQLEEWNGRDPTFAGRFDLTRVAAMGISWGGWVAAEFCRVDARCRAAVLFDPSGESGDLLPAGLPKPLLQANRSDNGDSALFTKAVRDAVWFQVSGTQHLNFDDMYWAIFPGSVAAGREAARAVNAYTLWFLNKYLKDLNEPLPTKEDYRRVTGLRQK